MKRIYLLSLFFLLISAAMSHAQEKIVIQSSAQDFRFWVSEAATIQSIDWGDGTTSGNSDADLTGYYLRFPHHPYSAQVKSFSHNYSGEQSRTIVITGNGITVFNGDREDCIMTSLDVSQAKKLQILKFHGIVTTVNASNLPDLDRVYLFESKVQRLDCSNCPKLRIMECSDTPLTSLNITGCDALEELRCEKTQLSRIKLYGGKVFFLAFLNNNNNLISIDATNCLACRHNEIEAKYCSSLTEIINPVGYRVTYNGSDKLKLPNPDGTVTLKVRDTDSGYTLIQPDGCETGFYIKNGNFASENNDWQFVIMGERTCLAQVPLAQLNYSYPKIDGTSKRVAVKPGYGYIACCWDKERRGHSIYFIYVQRELTDAAEPHGIIGAEIEYIGHPANNSYR